MMTVGVQAYPDPMASTNGALRDSHPRLESHEASLLELAPNVSTDELSLSEKEAQILELHDRIREQHLEEALLKQDPVEIGDVDNIDEQLANAERELLEARATYSLQKKAVDTVLMTEPTVQSIHSVSKTPVEKSLFRLVNRRDLLSLIYENLARAHSTCLESLSNAEIDNMKINEENKELVRSLLELTKPQEKTGKDLITDPKLKEQVETVEVENKQKRADWVIVKRIVSAAIVASGIDWASDEDLRELVIDESTEDT